MIVFFFVSLVVCDIFIDCEFGNDVNSGNSELNAWKSLNHSWSSNSIINLKSGCVWNEHLMLDGVCNVSVNSYGVGHNPTINLSSKINANWTKENDLFVCDVDEDVAYLFDGGVKYNFTHYPYGLNEYLYLSETQKNFKQFPINIDIEYNIINSTLVVRNSMWSFFSTKIVDYREGIIFTEDDYERYFPIPKGFGLKLLNKKWMIQNGTFFYENGKIYLKNQPTNDVRVIYSNVSSCIYLYNCNNVTINNMDLKKCRDRGINSFKSKNISITGVNINDCGTHGMYLQYFKGTVSNCNVLNSGHSGIHLYPNAYDSYVVNNTVKSTAIYGPLQVSWRGYSNMGMSIFTHCIGYCELYSNYIDGSGYIGIFLMKSNTFVHENIIKNSCLILDDCAGIQFFRGFNHTIINNLVIDSIGNTFGTPHKTRQYVANGIYSDLSENCKIIGNTIINVHTGLFIHGYGIFVYNMIIKDNFVYSRESAIMFWGLGFRDIILTNNLMFSIHHYSLALYSEYNESYFIIDNNKYYPDIIDKNRYYPDDSGITDYYFQVDKRGSLVCHDVSIKRTLFKPLYNENKTSEFVFELDGEFWFDSNSNLVNSVEVAPLKAELVIRMDTLDYQILLTYLIMFGVACIMIFIIIFKEIKN